MALINCIECNCEVSDEAYVCPHCGIRLKNEEVNQLVTLEDIFKDDKYYRIPEYQRGYAWDANKEFIQLWNDILSLYHSNNATRKHYTGMITLDKIVDFDAKNEGLVDTNSYYIVDGQQRITSLVIIIKAILDFAKDNNILSIVNDESNSNILTGKYNIKRFGYSNSRSDKANEFFVKRIYENNLNLTLNNQYFINIDNAANFVSKELNRYNDDDIASILNIVKNRLVFNQYFVTPEFDVRVTFETMNNRGKPLTNLEILKNRLMYLTTFLTNKNQSLQLLNKINYVWKNIYDNLNFKDFSLSDDEYLKAHWSIYHNLKKTKGDSYINDILNHEFSISNGTFYNFCSERKYDEAYNFINNYIESLDFYSLYWKSVNWPDSIEFFIQSNELDCLKRLSRMSLNLYIKDVIMVVLASKLNNTDKIQFYKKLENFYFINKYISQEVSDMSFLVTYAKNLANSQNIQKDYKNLIEILSAHKLAIKSSRINDIIYKFASKINNHSNYYYDWNGLKYFLYEYNDSLNISNAAKIEWYKLNSISIEHVLPQTPTSIYWQTSFKDILGTADERKVINSLGNLLLLSCGAENSALKNYSFPVKKDVSIESRKFAYNSGSRSAREVGEYDVWTLKEIYDRTIKLFNFMYDNWFKDYIEKTKWDKLIFDSKLINFDFNYSENNYLKLKDVLLHMDFSNERKSVSNILPNNNYDYLNNQLLEYFDKDLYRLIPNSKNLSYNEWKYSFVIKRTIDNKPSAIRISKKVDGHSYYIEYEYKTNRINIITWINNQPKSITDIKELPNELQNFLRSFKRYLKKARGIEEEFSFKNQ